jgi:putative restriction endonuclease
VCGEPALVKQRLGQGTFRLMTLDNYRHTCCITGEITRDVIEAAHILPVSKGGEHRLDNGLALRADMHILYDPGLLSVDPEHRLHVSSRIRELVHNGVVYYRHEGEKLRSLPEELRNRPNRELLDWHYREEFIA